MGYLRKVTEVLWFRTEKQVEECISDAKADNTYDLTKYSSTKKTLKEKGEIVDEWLELTLVKVFNDSKELDCCVSVDVSYTIGSSFGFEKPRELVEVEDFADEEDEEGEF